ncbi:hypothetical protein CAEBREN_02801 [Caenorhabditis brenneri]|uniref:Uncharacterized protein n=1 Tax=Caenorhabditis brenneri TaxID=135651 RepID=G0MR54_CAEBE|nr:hypothetical protein CAEBREN_02801 [Caenorhabditis brenneri]
MARLLLVILLTIYSIAPFTLAAPIPENETTIAFVLEATTTETTKTFIFPSDTSSNSSFIETQIVVETGDDDLVPIESENEDGVKIVHFPDSNSDSNEGENKVETHVAAGAAPVIGTHVADPLQEPMAIETPPPVDDSEPIEVVASIDDEDYSEAHASSDAPEIIVVPAMETSTVLAASEVTLITPAPAYESSITSPETPTTPKPSSAKPIMKTIDENTSSTTKAPVTAKILPVSSENKTEIVSAESYDLRYNGTDMDLPKHNGDIYPKTFWDQVNDTFAYLTKGYPKICIIVFLVLVLILLMLVWLVIRECCSSSRGSSPRTPRYQSVTADLYNTSSCSQYYSKPTLLPNQQDVTMQLIPTDVSLENV